MDFTKDIVTLKFKTLDKTLPRGYNFLVFGQQQFKIQWEPGSTNLADYFTKHHPTWHH